MFNTILCKAQVQDISELAKIKAGFGQADILARFEWLTTVDVTWYVGWIAHQPRGWALIQWQGKPTAPTYPDLFDLYVYPGWRGQGVGTQILRICEQIVRDAGHKKLGLAVNPDLNARAYRLYQSLGYVVISQDKYLDGVYDGVGDWVLDLAKNL